MKLLEKFKIDVEQPADIQETNVNLEAYDDYQIVNTGAEIDKFYNLTSAMQHKVKIHLHNEVSVF